MIVSSTIGGAIEIARRDSIVGQKVTQQVIADSMIDRQMDAEDRLEAIVGRRGTPLTIVGQLIIGATAR